MRFNNRIFLVLIFVLFLLSCNEGKPDKSLDIVRNKVSNIKKNICWKFIFLYTNVDVGVIPADKDFTKASFKILNNTKSNQLIDTVYSSCGCIMVDYPHHPIVKGDSSIVSMKIDLKSVRGNFQKQSWVYFAGYNSKPVILTVSGCKDW